jgi:hypothetical protein
VDNPKEFLKSIGLCEKPRFKFPYFFSRTWWLQAIHWPASHVAHIDAEYLESLSKEQAQKVMEWEARAAERTCFRKAHHMRGQL